MASSPATLVHESLRSNTSSTRVYGLPGAVWVRRWLHGITRLCCLSPCKVGGEWGPETDKRSKTLRFVIEPFRTLRPPRGSFRPGPKPKTFESLTANQAGLDALRFRTKLRANKVALNETGVCVCVHAPSHHRSYVCLCRLGSVISPDTKFGI